MPQSKVMHGARAVMWVGTTPVGIFNNVSYGVQYDVSPVYILGRFSAAELVYTGMEVIQVTAAGFRVMGNGPHAKVGAAGERLVPTVDELLTYTDITLTLHDRLDANGDEPVMTVTGVKPVGFSSSVGSRSLQEMTVTFHGLVLTDETAKQNGESSTAADLPASNVT